MIARSNPSLRFSAEHKNHWAPSRLAALAGGSILFVRSVAVFCFATFCFATGNAHAQGVDKARGKIWFTKQCSHCHGDKGEGKAELRAPSIAGLPVWYVERQLVKYRDGIRGNHPDDAGGQRMHPIGKMLKQESDLKSVSQFVAELPVVLISSHPASTEYKADGVAAGAVVKGEQRYQVCAACHGPDGRGNETLNAPTLIGLQDWYIVQQLKNFKSGLRGVDAAADVYGVQMRANALTLDQQAMWDLIAYIRVLGESATQATK